MDNSPYICPPPLRHCLHERALVYVRLALLGPGSEQPIRGQRDLALLARAWGFSRVELAEDLGVGGYSRGQRPGFAALLETLDTGDVAVVLCRDQSRLARNPADLELFYKEAKRHHVLLWIDGQLYDPQKIQ